MNLDPLFLERFHDRHVRYDNLLRPSLKTQNKYAQKRIITLVAARMSDNLHLLDGSVTTVPEGCSTRIKPVSEAYPYFVLILCSSSICSCIFSEIVYPSTEICVGKTVAILAFSTFPSILLLSSSTLKGLVE
jgi:hypothetical protein